LTSAICSSLPNPSDSLFNDSFVSFPSFSLCFSVIFASFSSISAMTFCLSCSIFATFDFFSSSSFFISSATFSFSAFFASASFFSSSFSLVSISSSILFCFAYFFFML